MNNAVTVGNDFPTLPCERVSFDDHIAQEDNADTEGDDISKNNSTVDVPVSNSNIIIKFPSVEAKSTSLTETESDAGSAVSSQKDNSPQHSPSNSAAESTVHQSSKPGTGNNWTPEMTAMCQQIIDSLTRVEDYYK